MIEVLWSYYGAIMEGCAHGDFCLGCQGLQHTTVIKLKGEFYYYF